MDEKSFFDFDLKNFSATGIDLSKTFATRYIKPPHVEIKAEECFAYENAQKLANDLTIEKGSRYFVVINGSFITGDFIEALVVKNNWHVKKMTISTLSYNENNVDSLANLINGGFVDELNLIVSGFFYSHERDNLIPYAYQKLDQNDSFQLAVADTHCKLCIFETHCGKFIVLHGSANLRSSANIEQLALEESEVLYRFNDSYQDRIIETFKTINKTVRRKKLWLSVTDKFTPKQ